MTNDELMQLKALAEAATPGPWDWGGTECKSQEQALSIFKENLDATILPGTHFCEVFLADGRRAAITGNGPTSIQNAAFIAAANPAAILALIAKVESLAADAERLDYIQTFISRSASRGFKWDNVTLKTSSNVREQIDAFMAKEKA